MNAPRAGIPLRPDYGAVRQRNVTSLVRAAIASGRAVFHPEHNPGRLAARTWPSDDGALFLTKAATSPASMTSASALMRTVVYDLLATLGPISAGAQLLQRGLQLDF